MRGVCAALIVGLATSGPVRAQSSDLVAPFGTLPVEARLRTMTLQATIDLQEPAVVLLLSYHPEVGWRPIGRIVGAGPRPLGVGRHVLTFTRRLGALQVPEGTQGEIVPAVAEGCGAAGGTYDPRSGHCGTGGSSSVGPVLPDFRVGTLDYRAGVVVVVGRVSATEVEAALLAARGLPPAEALRQVAERWDALGRPSRWAFLRVPRGADVG